MNMVVRIKKGTCILLVTILCLSAGITVNAENFASLFNYKNGGGLELQWTHVESVSVWLTIPNGKALCSSIVNGQPGTTRITGIAVLSRKNANNTYTKVKTWSNLETLGSRLIFDETYFVATGHTYRLTMTATVYRNGDNETITEYYDAYAE